MIVEFVVDYINRIIKRCRKEKNERALCNNHDNCLV